MGGVLSPPFGTYGALARATVAMLNSCNNETDDDNKTIPSKAVRFNESTRLVNLVRFLYMGSSTIVWFGLQFSQSPQQSTNQDVIPTIVR